MSAPMIVKPASQEAAIAPVEASGMAALLTLAVEKNIGVEGLERLVALQERILDRNAASEFFDAMSAFQQKCPPIPKSSKAEVKKEGRIIATYQYAELDTIARIINPILAPVGLSYSWDAVIDTTGLLTCTCTVRHRGGHKQTAQFAAPIGGTSLMSDAQKAAATLTYAKRQALVAALGLTTGDSDVDGAGEAHESVGITEEQAANLRAMLDEIGPDEADKFKKYKKVEALTDIPADDYAACVATVQRKRGAVK